MSTSKYVQDYDTQHTSYKVSVLDAAGRLRRLEDIEADVVRLAIARCAGRMSDVARGLALGRSTLYRKLKLKNW